jgi:hypothetical protein
LRALANARVDAQNTLDKAIQGKAMFLVEDKRHGTTYLVFTWEDPRKGGYKGNVIENVTLDYEMERVHRWPHGSDAPKPCVGRALDNPNHYKVFRNSDERKTAGYEPIDGTAIVFGSWQEYVGLHLVPPDPEQTDDGLWYDYLDKLDEDLRRRRQRVQLPEPPQPGNRDDVAAWVAKNHLITDSAVREVWYLPRGAPPDEIRLLELNDRLVGNESPAEAIDFGLDIEGVPFRLSVADITTEQLERIKKGSSHLPPGWSLDENRIWRRGA